MARRFTKNMVAITFGCWPLLHILAGTITQTKKKHHPELKSFSYIATIMWTPKKKQKKRENEKQVTENLSPSNYLWTWSIFNSESLLDLITHYNNNWQTNQEVIKLLAKYCLNFQKESEQTNFRRTIYK